MGREEWSWVRSSCGKSGKKVPTLEDQGAQQCIWRDEYVYLNM
jgi:hypothetical protein